MVSIGSMRRRVEMKTVTRLLLVAIGVAAVIAVGVGRSRLVGPANAQELKPVGGPSLTEFLHWPLPASDQAYGRIKGDHLKTYVDDIAAFTRNAREPGSQFWGRITGTPTDAKFREWVEARFQQIGLSDVRIEPFDVVEPQWMPTAWQVDVSAGAKTLKLTSVHPFTKSEGTPPGGALQTQAVWLGLGTKADFAGRDVRGKAAFIYSQ